ncbi:MAG: hypothetical protein COB36_10765 [Alphaproteobacteria bacterium]|nr:MAG: hypothetical protein COB36_10765 [Alphaproteobacteria bacterium]
MSAKIGDDPSGKKLAFLQSMASQGRKVPMLEAETELYPDLYVVWQAYVDLSSSRNENGSIPASEVITYNNHFDVCETRELLRYVRAMDAVVNRKSSE